MTTLALLVLSPAFAAISISATTFSSTDPYHLNRTGYPITPTISVTGADGGNSSYWNDGSLLAYYPFDYNESGYVTTDVTQNYNGTVSGAVWTSSGKVGGGYSFDGITSKIFVSDIYPNLNITGSITVMAWINTSSSVCDGECWVVRKLTPSTNIKGYGIKAGSTSSRFHIGNGTELSVLCNDDNIGWSFIVGRFDNTTKNLSIFANGVSCASAIKNTSISTSNSNLNIGYRDNPYYFNGTIDDVRIYNRALNAAEILELYNSTAEGRTERCTSGMTCNAYTGSPITYTVFSSATDGTYAKGSTNFQVQTATINTTGCYATLTGSYASLPVEFNYTKTLTSYGRVHNITTDGLVAQKDFSSWQTTFTVVLAAAVVLTMIYMYFKLN